MPFHLPRLPRLALALAATTFALAAHAQGGYPAKPLTWIVPFAAGGPTDAMAREIAQRTSTQLGQQIIIENVPGAGGTIGAAKAARSAPDGYSFLVGHGFEFGLGLGYNVGIFLCFGRRCGALRSCSGFAGTGLGRG